MNISESINGLTNQDSNVRLISANALGNIGPAACPAVDSLISMLDDESFEVCRAAATALGKIGHMAEKSIMSLLRIMKIDDPRTNSIASSMPEVLAGLFPPLSMLSAQHEMAYMLADCLSHNNEDIRYAAAYGLSKLIVRSPALNQLIESLSDDSPSVRFWCSASLRDMGVEISPAVDSIIEKFMLDDENMCFNLVDAIFNCIEIMPNTKGKLIDLAQTSPEYLRKYIYSIV